MTPTGNIDSLSFLRYMLATTFNVLHDFQGFRIDGKRAQFAVLYSRLQGSQRCFFLKPNFEQQLKLCHNTARPKNKKKMLIKLKQPNKVNR